MTAITYKTISEMFKILNLSMLNNKSDDYSTFYIINTKEKKSAVIKFLEYYGVTFKETNNGYETDVLCIEYFNTTTVKKIIVT